MVQRQEDRALREVLETAERILTANGFQVVTGDASLFPKAQPALSALGEGRLLICVAKTYSITPLFLNPDEINRIRNELEALIIANRPERDPRVKSVEKIALVLVPGDIAVASSEGDVKWVVVEEVEEMPEEMDKVLG